MFEVGKRYMFRMIDGLGESEFSREVEAYEHPIVKLRAEPERDIPERFNPAFEPGTHAPRAPQKRPGKPAEIINVACLRFIGAVELPD